MTDDRYTSRRSGEPTLGWYELPIVGEDRPARCGLGLLAASILGAIAVITAIAAIAA